MHYLKQIIYYIKRYRHRSLFIKNFIIILLLVAIPFNLLVYWFSADSQNRTIAEFSTSNTAMITTTKEVMVNLISEAKMFCVYTTFQSDVTNYVLSSPPLDSNGSLQSRINQYIREYKHTHDYIDSVYIYNENNNVVLSNIENKQLDSFSDKEWLKDYENIELNTTSISSRTKNELYPFLITIMHPISIVDNTKSGLVVVNIDVLKLINFMGSNSKLLNNSICIVDKNQKIIYNKDYNLIGRDISADLVLNTFAKNELKPQRLSCEGVEYLISQCSAEGYGWNFYSCTPLTFYQEHLNANSHQKFLIFLFTIFISLILSLLISIRAFMPVKNIISVLQDSDSYYAINTNDRISNELSYILNSIANKTKTVNELEAELSRRLALLNQAQTAALQAQINPHFLCNTLENINWTAIQLLGRDNQVSTMLSLVADLYKLNVDTKTYLVSLSDEISHAICYIKILMIRHNGAFSVNWNINPELLDCKVARLSLQPIIENAIYHGIKSNDFHENINISAQTYKDNEFIITIEDNGEGITPDMLKEINYQMNEDYNMSSDHIGIKNVNQRIKLIFGDNYGINIESTPGKGTKVIMHYPLTADNETQEFIKE